MMIQKFIPIGPSRTTISYEVYRNKSSTDEQFRAIADTYRRVMGEDKVLCEGVQKNLNAGVFANGELHPHWEKGPLFFQQTVREVISEHFQREKAEKREIWPARQKLAEGATMSEGDMEICEGLGCGKTKEVLAW